jgi:hypothetical protein
MMLLDDDVFLFYNKLQRCHVEFARTLITASHGGAA